MTKNNKQTKQNVDDVITDCVVLSVSSLILERSPDERVDIHRILTDKAGADVRAAFRRVGEGDASRGGQLDVKRIGGRIATAGGMGSMLAYMEGYFGRPIADLVLELSPRKAEEAEARLQALSERGGVEAGMRHALALRVKQLQNLPTIIKNNKPPKKTGSKSKRPAKSSPHDKRGKATANSQ